MNTHTNTPIRLADERAFTLIEMLVAIAAVGLLAVGIAQVFSATGKTVSAGRKLSNLNTAAALIERQMRSDFDAMTREGFLIMRHQYANNRNFAPGNQLSSLEPTDLYPEDENPRPRRVDEIQFAVRGKFATERDPRHPDRKAESSAALVYYGHGQRRDPLNRERPSIPQDLQYDAPVRVDDDNALAGPLGFRYADINANSGTNANRYASEWTLARSVTLLSPPEQVARTVRDFTNANLPAIDELSAVPTGYGGRTPLDSPFQVAWQPAQPEFRLDGRSFLQSGYINTFPTTLRAPASPPRRASGVVDIIAQDLTTIRQSVLGDSTGSPGAGGSYSQFATGFRAPKNWDEAVVETVRQQSNMIYSLPGASDLGQRLRVEPSAPNLLGVGTGWNVGDLANVFGRAAALTDQQMLANHSFMPRCSEFIVEWSFGDIDVLNPGDPYSFGRMKWFGLDRRVKLNASTATPAEIVVGTYKGGRIDPHYQVYKRRDGTSVGFVVPPELVGVANAQPGGITGTYSTFGFINTFYSPLPGIEGTATEFTPANLDASLLQGNPRRPGQTGLGALIWDTNLDEPLYDRNSNLTFKALPTLLRDVPTVPSGGGAAVPNNRYDPEAGDELLDPDTIPWPWPKLIRVTIGLVDSNDPKLERTFQFIFRVPGAQGAERD